MTDTRPRILFMGTPQYAVASLAALHERGYDIAAVVTAPDRPAGRGQKLTASPVKKYALENHLRVEQPLKLRDPAFIDTLRQLNADLFVVVAFRMLPEVVWRLPRLGTFNLHASLLPQYRGAAPINHAIINGERVTGVTTFFIDNEIDSGMILMSRSTPIEPHENAGSLHDRLMVMGAQLVIETTEGVLRGTLTPHPQKMPEGGELKKAPKLYPADMLINWHRPAISVHNQIRGLSPQPGATTILRRGDQTMRLKVTEALVRDDITAATPATLIVTEKKSLVIGCDEGALEIVTLIPEGRKPMSSVQFLQGYDLKGWRVQ